MTLDMKDHLGDNPPKTFIKKAKKMDIDIGNFLCDIHCCWYVQLDKRVPEYWSKSKCKQCS